MPLFKVKAPDGSVINVNAPEGATEQQAIEFAASSWKPKSATPAQQTQTQAQPKPEAPSGFVQGLKDPITAGAQLLAHVLPEPVVEAGNRLNNWLADRGVPVARIPSGGTGGMDALVKQQEADYQAQRQAAGETGTDWARIGGNVLNPVNLLAASRLPQAASLAGRIGVGATSGAGFGAMQPVTQGDFWTEKAKQIGIGAGSGGALPLVAGTVARVIRPQTRPQVKAMLNEGITPTVGQIIGGRAQVIEDKLTSLPILGDAISSARGKSLDEFQRSAFNRALSPIGEKSSGALGREGIAEVHSKLSNAYESLLPKMTFKADQQFADEMSNLSSLVSNLPADNAHFFEGTLRRELFGRMTPQGLMSGRSLQDADSAIGNIAKNYSGKGGFEGDLGNAFKEVQNILRANIDRNNPQYAKELGNIRKGWANYAILRDAASRPGSKEGMFTPAQLGSAVASAGKTGQGAAGKAKVSEGKALMQDLTDAAQNVLSSKYPDSGTTGRMFMGIGTAGGMGMIEPSALMATGLTSLAYLPGGRQTLSALLTKRPDASTKLAELIRQTSPALTPGAVSFLNQR